MMPRYFSNKIKNLWDAQSFLVIKIDHYSTLSRDPITQMIDWRKLSTQISEDIDVEFGTFHQTGLTDTWGPPGLCGYRILAKHQLPYFGVAMGDNHELPVFFIIYWEGIMLRAYVPTKGNPFNTNTRVAYGNNLEADRKNLVERYGFATPEEAIQKINEIKFDSELIIEDLEENIFPI